MLQILMAVGLQAKEAILLPKGQLKRHFGIFGK